LVDDARACEKVDAALWCVGGLAQWDGLQLRVKASRLFGSQSVARYTGRKVRPPPSPPPTLAFRPQMLQTSRETRGLLRHKDWTVAVI
jgi:hypothetical protein